ncbi:MAG: RidA family protein [Candidatus Hydrogenedentes bacterium]|nr:RidA family protein [Candidatus Hydrogenedentota bacterium]
MDKCVLKSKNGPPAVGPYSHAVKVGNLLFISGQGPFKRDGSGPLKGTFAEEVEYTLENLRILLEEFGSNLDSVVKVTVFLADMQKFSEFNSIYSRYFSGNNYPARSCVGVSQLPGGISIEIDAIALCES